jgi:hypothetical protein
MEIKIEFGSSPGPMNGQGGFFIWKSVKGGPASGVNNIAWTDREDTADMICEALRKTAPGAASWRCPHCQETHVSRPKLCNYCGTKPEAGN